MAVEARKYISIFFFKPLNSSYVPLSADNLDGCLFFPALWLRRHHLQLVYPTTPDSSCFVSIRSHAFCLILTLAWPSVKPANEPLEFPITYLLGSALEFP